METVTSRRNEEWELNAVLANKALKALKTMTFYVKDLDLMTEENREKWEVDKHLALSFTHLDMLERSIEGKNVHEFDRVFTDLIGTKFDGVLEYFETTLDAPARNEALQFTKFISEAVIALVEVLRKLKKFAGDFE